MIGLVHFSGKSLDAVDLLPSNEGRQSLVQQLMKGYGLLNHAKVRLLAPKPASVDDLARFHDRDYAVELLKPRNWKQHESELSRLQQTILRRRATRERPDDRRLLDQPPCGSYGLAFDCPIFPHMDEYCSGVAGGSVQAAEFLMQNPTVAINWAGGRHHAHKSHAAGYCYVNDAVLAILRLRRKYSRIMYIDFDLHHGDGVANAFKLSNNVLTVSVHRADAGFFPGTGLKPVDGRGRGQGYEINIPTKRGLCDASLEWIVSHIVVPKIEGYRPQCLVIQCGADGLCTDSEFREWNLTASRYGQMVCGLVRGAGIPTLLLGGGGYNSLETCKLWCYITGLILDQDCQGWAQLPDDLDDELVDFRELEFWTHDRPRNMAEQNTHEYLLYLQGAILGC
ncbi:hypothetical protein KL921_002305 [Ogataea angusta]|uniref:histone deacetylase n=1 Tax=Pichia angusta TaxID=870730 RepID=A0AAN6DIF4_PICAN|nr:uncharacterized protein KL928_002486 [Ogataea angusta]KAG7812039.1 hypothetical protein KL921_002305 [Ogataea angusta]KAG7819812.1 hypothetical protein KL928_002486 [Ogataea angusta]KAG7830617.1 hypothetical protein KL920_001208 [Ogataea angusta]KAG7834835.1 hypothetical protein KL943_002150 [Ogataea angusta]KAG7861100.1 hypothetical protein KL919_001834 [Ogataea angusta]